MQLVRGSILLATMLLLFTIVASDSNAKTEVFLPKSFRATFIQEFKRSLHGKKKENKGVLDFESPGKFRFELSGKTNMIVVSNQLKTWHYKPPYIQGERGELKESATKKNTFVSFFDMIRNGLVSNEDYTVKKASTPNTYVLKFSKKRIKELGIKEGELFFHPQKGSKSFKFENLESFSLTYKSGKRAKFIFSKIKINKTFTSKHFEFHAPPGTRKTSI